jgi:hypothetical protein
MLALPDAQLPRFAPHDCEECGAKLWTWVTRLNPQTWTAEAFEEIFDIDYEDKSIKVKPGKEDGFRDEFYEIAHALGLDGGL